MIEGLKTIEVVSLFVEDLHAVKAFYVDVFGSEVLFEDDDSVAVRFDNLLINLLKVDEAPELIEPAAVGRADAGSRFMFTVRVDDADAVCAQLERHGVRLLNGPVGRPWGRRTAAFADPAGNVWEVAQDLPRSG